MTKHLPLILALLLAGAPTLASVRCEIDGQPLPVADEMADFNTSPRGDKGFSGHVSLFRLMTRDEAGDAPSSGIELKTQDVLGVGGAEMSTRRGWRSELRWKGDDLKVSEGRFQFTRFEPTWPQGRAAGTLEFKAGGRSGRCQFDVQMKVIDRDRIRAGVGG